MSGLPITTSYGTAIVNQGIIVPDNSSGGPPFIFDSSNTSGFLINSERDSVKVCFIDYFSETVLFGNWGFAPPPIRGHYIWTANYLSNYDILTFDFSQPNYGQTMVIINEINSNGTWAGSSNFIELYNKGDQAVNLTGWRLVCDTIYDFPAEAIIPPHGFYVIDEPDLPVNFATDYMADNIYLIAPDSDLVDQVGWSTNHGRNVSFMRFPDGDADSLTYFWDFCGFDDETSTSFENGFPSRSAPNRHQSPGFVVIGTNADSAGDRTVQIAWTNPVWDQSFDRVELVKSTVGFPAQPQDGTLIYVGAGQEFIDSDIIPNRANYYTVFAVRQDNSHSTATFESQDSITLGGLGVEDDQSIPSGFELSCYPNPFNGRTIISFSLQKQGPAKITIYDITGKLVQTLAESFFPAGRGSIVWQAADLPSGIYFYRLATGQETITGRAVLVK